MLFAIETQPTLIKEIRVAQLMDLQLERIKQEVLSKKASRFVIHKNDSERFHIRVCILVMERI